MKYCKNFLRFVSILLAVVIVALPMTAHAAEGTVYYIDAADGSDSSDGKSPANAWQTVEPIKSISLSAGDSILFKRGGDYECELSLTCLGTKEQPIVLSSYGNESEPLAHLYTNNHADVLRLIDCSYVTVDSLEITAHNGGGIWIDTLTRASVGITLSNLDMHDMQNFKVNSRDDFSTPAAARACVLVKELPSHSRFPVNDLTVRDCEMYDCGNGLIIWGSWNEQEDPWCEKEEDIDPVFNTGTLVKNVYFHDMDAEAVIVGMCDGALVTDCRSINCCQGEGTDENGKVLYYTAAMWFWGSVNSTIQYCEIAGQKNVGDGMAVDFDSYSHNCTYQYIYSHDNTRFICNNPMYSGHKNNTVRYCLSVNDNRGKNCLSVRNEGEHGFKFYNNTIINASDIRLWNIYDSVFANNIVTFAPGHSFLCDSQILRDGNVFENNCYYGAVSPVTDLSAKNILPGFVNPNGTTAEAYMLLADSPLINAGAIIDGAPTLDLYGNTVGTPNIGCYGGDGIKGEAEYPHECLLARIVRYFGYIIDKIIQDINY